MPLWKKVPPDRSARLRSILTGHNGSVEAVAIAPDGTWLATAGDDGTVRIWDPATGQPAPPSPATPARWRRWRSPRTAPGWPPPAATGRCGSGTPTPAPHRATLTGHTGAVDAVAIAPDGTWLATAGDDGTGADLGRRHRPRTAPPSPATPARWTAVAIAPDGTWLATPAADDGTVRIWDADTGQPAPPSPATPARWTAVAVAPDGTWLATASDDGTVRIWDPATGPPRATLTGHTGAVCGGGDRPGRDLAGHRQRRRDGADLGRRHRPPPRRPSPATPAAVDGGGDRPGRHLAGHRQLGRDGADLGPRHRHRRAPPSPATPAR